MLTAHSDSRAEELSARPRVNHPAESLALFPGVLLLFTLVTVIFFRQWMPHLNSALIGPPEDNMQDFWNTWYTAVARNPGHFFFTNLIRFPEGTPLYYHIFRLPKSLCHRSALEIRRHQYDVSDLATKSQSTDFFPPSRHWRLLSGAVSHREYGRRTAGRLSLCLQSIARGACDASCSCFVDRIHSVLRAYLSTDYRKEKPTISAVDDHPLCA